ncbi:Uma2 family endonuclease [Ruminococcus sp. NK3A76]|uniref:Uma2 family endonuclease n=1 Tax=Ruminococcus sp. NK3A76 TaxID=877411 RepID=UPI00048AF057|nr:Uma2 family endonuclease [Ruminococcus sp. NK3A76]
MPLAEKKKYTAEEYFAKTQDTNEHTELIDGEIVALAAPDELHFDISFSVCSMLRDFISKNGGSCKPFMAPFDVVLDEYNVVQPDIFVVCDADKRDGKRINGAPDLVIEVVSSNRSDDYVRKLALYKESGVREYWIIDPKFERTLVYDFDNGDYPQIYPFSQDIPVGIYKGVLTVNVAKLLS